MLTNATLGGATIAEFLLARIADTEKELDKENMSTGAWVLINQVLANQRYIIEWHKSFPVLVEQEPVYTPLSDYDFGHSIDHVTLHMSKKITWLTEQSYRDHFGTEPPTSPLLREWASLYSHHPDYKDEWKV